MKILSRSVQIHRQRLALLTFAFLSGLCLLLIFKASHAKGREVELPLETEPEFQHWNANDTAPITFEPWQCLSTCCLSRNRTNDYFKGQPGHSPVERDVMSPMNFKLLADLHYGDDKQPEGVRTLLQKLSLSTVPCLQPGVVIFVDTVASAPFLEIFFPLIKVPFVLISGDSDQANPYDKKTWETLTSSPLVLHWFVGNYRGPPEGTSLFSKLSLLPIGNNQWRRKNPLLMGAYQDGYGLLNGTLQRQREKLAERPIIVAFHAGTNKAIRDPLWDLACKSTSTLASLSDCNSIPPEDFYGRLQSFKFVLSPHGAGLDCFRTWEGLYLGVYPIVKTSTLDPLYVDLPVLIVKDWTDITPELLDSTYAHFQNSKFDFEKLWNGYWYDRFRSFGYVTHKYLGVEVN